MWNINKLAMGKKLPLVGVVLAGTLEISSNAAFAAETIYLEEVVVTAQRREQNLQDVPVSVSAFSGDYLKNNNIKSATEYLALSPNASYTEDGQSGSRGLGISVRGINNLVSGETAFINSVGIYLDEFSVASVPNQVANPQLPDMQRVEVLRGPQGTFFGRNSLGGALNLTTRKPTDEFGGEIIVGAESYDNAGDQYNITAILNLPVSDTFRMRGVLYAEDSDGTVDNACASGALAENCPAASGNGVTPSGANDSGHQHTMFRLNSLWDATDDTTVATTFVYSQEEQDSDENVPSGVLDLDSADTFGLSSAINPGTGFYPDNRNVSSHDLKEFTDNDSTVAILNITHEVNDAVVVKSITGLIDAEMTRLFDNDLIGGLDALSRDNTYKGFSWSTELRLEVTETEYDFVVGVLYAQDDQEQENKVGVSSNPTGSFGGVGLNLPPFPQGLGLLQNSRQFEVESIAVFADYTWHLDDQWDLVLGARYTHDEVISTLNADGIRPSCTGCSPADAVFFPSFINAPRPEAKGRQTFSDIAPRLVARYQMNDDVSVYGSISKGYKAGGTTLGNDTNAPGSPAIITAFDEETLWNYEVGLKSELMGKRIRFNAAAYFIEWNDLQLEAFRLLTPGDLSSNFEQTINIENAEAYGFEIEIIAAVTQNLTLSGGLGYQNTEITSNTQAEITGGFTVDLQGLEVPKAPEITANFVAEYRWIMAGNDTWARLEWIHRDGQYSDVEGLTNKQTRGPSPNSGSIRNMPNGEFPYRSPDYNLVNLRAGMNIDQWRFNLYVQNLTDEEYYTGTQENFGASGIRLRPHPRIVGGSVSYSF